MLHRVARRWGVPLLVAALAWSTTMVDAAASAPTKKTPTVSHSTQAKTKSGKKVTVKRRARRSPAQDARARHHRIRRRLPPPGGVYARHAIVLDSKTGEVLFAKDAGAPVPIASLTKLMTATVFMEQKPDLDREVEVTRAEMAGAGRTRLHNHERVRLGDLLHMSLMCSDNCATRVLARESGLPADTFIARMNQRAAALGLTHTHFVEFTGLDERNVSTAADVAHLLQAAAVHPLFCEITTTRSYEFRSNRWDHAVHNTNRLLYSRYEILGGKTGFISEAGYCFATWVRDQGRDVIAVVLGAPTNATRFADVVRLLNKVSTEDPAATAR